MLRAPRSVEAEELTPATYGSVLLPLFAGQARLLRQSSHYEVTWSHETGVVPPLPTWLRAGPSDALQPSPLFELPVPPEEEPNPWATAVRAALRR